MAWLPNKLTIKAHHVLLFRWWQFDNCRQMFQLVFRAFKVHLMHNIDERTKKGLTPFPSQWGKNVTHSLIMKIIIAALHLAWWGLKSQLTEFLDGIPWWNMKCPWYCTNGNPFNLEQTEGHGKNLNYNLVLLRLSDTRDHTEIRVSPPLDTYHRLKFSLELHLCTCVERNCMCEDGGKMWSVTDGGEDGAVIWSGWLVVP